MEYHYSLKIGWNNHYNKSISIDFDIEDIYPGYCLRVGIEVDGVVLLPLDKVPPGLDVRDLHGVADGLDVGAGGACRQRRKFKRY